MEKAKFKITLIGAGNLATRLGIALHAKGFQINQVFSRTKDSADELAKKLKTEAVTSLKLISNEADIYIISVKDDAIEKVAEQLDLSNKYIIHTSGSADLKILKKVSKNYGVIYPLQTFSKNKAVNFNTIPVFYEGSNQKTEKVLEKIAKSLSKNTYHIDTEKRKKLHLAAVFANNFSNHMYTLAAKLLEESGLKFELLIPLISETANKVKTMQPQKAQTGPAIRNDEKLLKKHIGMLKKDKTLKKIYKLISKEIRKFN